MILDENAAVRHGDVLFFDFGRDAFARLDLILEGKGGEKVEVALGECLFNGGIDRRPGGYAPPPICVYPRGYRYFTAAELELKAGTWRYSFPIPRHVSPDAGFPNLTAPPGGEIAPFRYVEISGYSGRVRLERFSVHAPFDDSAAVFECDDSGLNRIWEFCKYSIKATTPFGVYVDGNRERISYEGDTYINQLGHFCCDRSYTMARDTISRLLVHPTYPAEWRLLMPVIVRDYVLYSGDSASVPGWLPELKKRLLPDRLLPDGLQRGEELRDPPYTRIHDIVDWPAVERDGYEFGSINFVPNCYYHAALNAMGELTGEAEYFHRAAVVKKTLREKFLRNGLFTDNPETAHVSLHSAMFAVVFGVAEQSEFPALAKFIVSRGMSCSVYGAQYLLDACYRLGLGDHARSLLTSTGMRSWNNMLEKGATISMEAWDDSAKPNQDWNHAWGAAPANLIPRFLCGVRPTKPGFAEYTVMPCPGGVKQFYLRHPTPRGMIEVWFDNGKVDSKLSE